MQTISKLLVGAALMTCASTASADTLVQTASSFNGPAYANSFDASLGTLNSVTVESTYFANLYFSYFAEPGTNNPPVVALAGTLGDRNLGIYDFTNSYQSTYAQANVVRVRLQGSATATNTTDFSAFTGRGSVFLGGMFNLTSASLPQATVSFPGSSGGSFRVVYDYTAAVPENSTWLMLVTGFGIIAGATRYRRKAFKPSFG